MKRYMIIGSGTAAVGCLEGIRSVDREGTVTMISKEGRMPYYRPLISYYLQGKTDFDQMKYRPDGFYKDNNCDVIFASAESIDSVAKTVRLDNGSLLLYDELCVATGSSPFVPPFTGLDTVNDKCSFMTEADALSLKKAVTEDSDVMIVGAGLIGLKCAEGLCGRAKSITVCDLAPRVLSSILDDSCAQIVQKRLLEHGIGFILGDSVEHFETGTAYMKSGKQLHFDVLVLAVGVRANISLFKEAGSECERGIIVDTSMHTSLDSVYAAGDCAQGYDSSIDDKRIIAILPNAYFQGNCAGINMAGGNMVFDSAFPMNAIGFFGLHALTAGSYEGGMYETYNGDSVKRLFVRDGRLTGFILIGDTIDRAGIYTSLIRDRVLLDEIDFELIKKTPTLAAFTPEYRKKKLGGVV
jgi:NAD(P)H-nitrite reductase large subunit